MRERLVLAGSNFVPLARHAPDKPQTIGPDILDSRSGGSPERLSMIAPSIIYIMPVIDIS
jgi:hypothetical protein